MIQVGCVVRKYDSDGSFDEGVVIAAETAIVVDFYDWLERWPIEALFTPLGLYYENRQVLTPAVAGTVIKRFDQSGLPT